MREGLGWQSNLGLPLLIQIIVLLLLKQVNALLPPIHRHTHTHTHLPVRDLCSVGQLNEW